MNKKLKSLLVILLTISMIVPMSVVRAASLTSIKDTLSTLKASTAANHEIIFNSPTGVALSSNVTITFPGGFTIGSVAFGDIDIATNDNADCSLGTYTDQTVAAAADASTWGANFAGSILTLDAPTSVGGNLAANRCLRVRIGTNASGGTNQIINHATPALYSISIAGAFGDTGDIAIPILTNDQVTVNASVAQALTFSISSTTIGFGTLSSSNVRYASNNNLGTTTPNIAHDLQASTNSSAGYSVTVKGPTLTYSGNTIDYMGTTNAAIASGTEQFGVHYVATGTGSGVVSTPYDGAGYAYGNATNTATIIASASAATNNNWFNATYIANIQGLTEAGSYTTALTYVATANY